MQTIVHSNPDMTKKPWCDIRDKMGSYNRAPYNWRRVSEREMAMNVTYNNYSPIATESRQLLRYENGDRIIENGKPVMLPVRLFWYHDGTGYAIRANRETKQMEYYFFGCSHKYHELSQGESRKKGISHYGMHCHVYECEKCGDIQVHDSSD